MSKLLLPVITSLFLPFLAAQADPAYEFVPNWLTPPPGRETIGSGHGEIGVDSSGKIYVSVDGQKEGGLQVYTPEGKFIESLKGVPDTLHGFVIHREGGEEFIYAAVLGHQKVIKLKLDGTPVMEIPKTAFPADKAARVSIDLKSGEKVAGYVSAETPAELTVTAAEGKTQTVPKDEIAKRQDTGLKLTSVDVAPNGDIYVVDGYGADWIFVFDKDGKFKKVFGGRVAPYNLSNCHKIFMDPRFQPVRLFLCDRGNNRILHLSLDGDIIGVIADKGLRKPSSASFHGDLVVIAEIAGRVSVFDKEGRMVATLGVNDNPGESNTPAMKPAQWREGTVTSPHGITFDAQGDILETEWNNFGRVLRWNAK